MHPKFLDLLRCPQTQQNLKLVITELGENGCVMNGKLCTLDGLEYPIVRGIPRFVSDEQYANSFGYEWNRWPRVQFDSANVGTRLAGYTTRMWEKITGISQVQNQTIIEFGCGPGRFLDVVVSKGGIAVGLDLSIAVEAARANFRDNPNVLIVQGDLLSPPFKKGIFDGAYTIGVLHHTPDPAKGLTALSQLVRPAGWISCCVYPKGEFYDFKSVARWRAFFNKIHTRFGYTPALVYSWMAANVFYPFFPMLKRVPFLAKLVHYIQENWLVFLSLPDVRWRFLDVFDAVTPTIATTHTAQEVESWFIHANCININQTSWCKTSYTAQKAT